jgi:cobalt-precorrin 5A hydrolase/precorrin-3B C17-methyltransferase
MTLPPSLAAIATTPTALQTLAPLGNSLKVTLYHPDSLTQLENTHTYTGSLKSFLASIWGEYRALIFCLATGAVVRLIAPLLEDKSHDPAIIVIEQTGKFVISLCSGHQGGADQLTRIIAHQLGATPIITGASASLNLPAIDCLGFPWGWRKGTGDWTGVSATIARQERVKVIQETGSTLWQNHLPSDHPFDFEEQNSNLSIIPQAKIWISASQRQFSPDDDYPQIQWHPRVLWVGIGCIRGTSAHLINTAITQVFQQYNLALSAIAGLATIDLKADETGILNYCVIEKYPLKIFTPEVLKQVQVPNPSPIVAQEVGTASVAEAAAILAANSSKTSENSDINSLIVGKQIIKSAAETEAVTLAIAQTDREYIDKIGKLFLVGIGPGSGEQITPAAKIAISEADVIIGYSLYIKLIETLQRPGQIIETSPITQEKQRAQRAIELARWGLTVAVISSGDCGIYGMAGLVLETLQSKEWDGKNPQVQVFPGITALQAAAARVGSPLMHDFCSISLSDLLTPWTVIEKRLEAAAKADFVTALYNPRSQNRQEQIVIAQQIFLQYRDVNTPVAIVRSAYRRDENIIITTLEKMLQFPIDMLSLVLIGNQSTYQYQDWIITPRGYQ